MERVDIAVVGGGPIGSALALALSDTPFSIALLDAAPIAAPIVTPNATGAADVRRDPRTLALSHATRLLLQRLNAWDDRAATPITDIHVSQMGGFGRTALSAAEHGLPALGHVVAYADLAAAIAGALARTRVARISDSLVSGCDIADDGAILRYRRNDEEHKLGCRLVVHAEGTPGKSDGQYQVRDYGQVALVCNATPKSPHRKLAWERFTPSGPLALLPHGGDYAVVLTLRPDEADAALALPDAAFLDLLAARMGGRVAFSACGPRHVFPLTRRHRPIPVAARSAWIGNAAQTLHPVAGQGFNLGLRDAWELAELLRGLPAGADPGAEAVLAAFAARRRGDRTGALFFTDLLARAFADAKPVDANPLVAAGRGAALTACDLLPPLRRFLARRMIYGARALP